MAPITNSGDATEAEGRNHAEQGRVRLVCPASCRGVSRSPPAGPPAAAAPRTDGRESCRAEVWWRGRTRPPATPAPGLGQMPPLQTGTAVEFMQRCAPAPARWRGMTTLPGITGEPVLQRRRCWLRAPGCQRFSSGAAQAAADQVRRPRAVGDQLQRALPAPGHLAGDSGRLCLASVANVGPATPRGALPSSKPPPHSPSSLPTGTACRSRRPAGSACPAGPSSTEASASQPPAPPGARRTPM